MGNLNSTEGNAHISHANPSLKSRKLSNFHTDSDTEMDTAQTLSSAKAKPPPKPKQKLHYRCTIVDCGKDFDKFEDLDNHTITNHSEILEIPVRLSQGKSEEFATKMLYGAIITTIARDIEPASIKNGRNEKYAHPPTPPAEEEVGAALGKAREEVIAKATEARPTLAKWTMRMNRNALANPDRPYLYSARLHDGLEDLAMGNQAPGISKRQSLESTHPDPDNIAVACPYCEKTAKYGLLRDRPQDELKKWYCPHCDKLIADFALSRLENELKVFGWLANDPEWTQWHENANETLRPLQSLTGSVPPSPAVLSNQANPFEHGSQSHGLAPPRPAVLRARTNPIEQGSQDRGVSSDASSYLYMKNNHSPFEISGLRPVGSRGISHDRNPDTGGRRMHEGRAADRDPGEGDEITRDGIFASTVDIAQSYGARGIDNTSGVGVGAAPAGSPGDTGLGNTKDGSASRGRFAILSSNSSGKYLMSWGRSPGTSPDKNTTENRDITHAEGEDNDGLPGAEGEGKTAGTEAEESGETGSRGSRHSSASRGSCAVYSAEGSEE
ncbi:hypothetical protein BDZ45DRAFT_688936 [Acephala macrosclerotiorum]|nr:hypothetical protein BDZ45DRAFT_688936 [Acephala macrosclerotiorum]